MRAQTHRFARGYKGTVLTAHVFDASWKQVTSAMVAHDARGDLREPIGTITAAIAIRTQPSDPLNRICVKPWVHRKLHPDTFTLDQINMHFDNEPWHTWR